MAAPTREDLLAAVPAEAADLLRRALALPAAQEQARIQLVREAFTAAAYPDLATGLPELASLTPAHRALLELGLELPRALPHSFAVPTDTWNLARWLGRETPGVLEAPAPGDGRPLWRVLEALQRDGDGDGAAPREALVRALPLPQRLEAIVELSVGAYRLRAVSGLSPEELVALGPEGAAVAPGLADWLVALRDGPDWFRSRGQLPADARWAVFMALVRGRVPIAPRWDQLLPLAGSAPLLELTLEAIAALPPERRAAAVVRAARGMHPHYFEQTLLALLPAVPDPALVEQLADNAEDGGGRPRRALQDDLRALAQTSPALAAAVESFPFREPGLDLWLRELPRPTSGAGLTELQRQQLRVSADFTDLHLYNLFTVHDAAGTHLYDTSLFCWDDGAVYRAGTTERVTSFCQGGADCEDDELREALDFALHRFRAGMKPDRG